MKQLLLFTLVLLTIFPSCKKTKTLEPHNFVSAFANSYGTTEDDYAIAGLVDGDHLLVTGQTKGHNSPAGTVYLIKLNLNGEVIWERTYPGHEGTKIIAAEKEQYFLIGNTYSEGAGKSDIFLMKLNRDGEVIWKQTYGGPEQDVGGTLVSLADGTYILAGTTESYGAGSRDIWILGLSATGNVLWQKTFGGPERDGSSDLEKLNDGTIMMFGYTSNYGAPDRDFYLLNISEEGDSLWSGLYGGDEYEESQDMAIAPDGSIYLCGHSASMEINHSMIGMKLDKKRKVVWERHIGGPAHEGAMGGVLDMNGNWVIAGRTNSFGNGDDDVYMAKISPAGLVLKEKTFGGDFPDLADDIVESDDAYFIIGRTLSASAGEQNIYIVKMKK